MDIRRETVPIIFHVRSSLANFLRSTFSSFSFLNFWGAADFVSAFGGGAFCFGFAAAGSFSGFSVSSGVVDFFSLLAICSKIGLQLLKISTVAAFRQNISYFFIMPISMHTHPMMKKTPPIGVKMPMAAGTTLFIA